MPKNKQTKIIKRTLIVLFSAIAIIFLPYFIGELAIPTHLLNINRDEPPILFKWVIGLGISVAYGALLFLLAVLLIEIYQWIISE